MTTISIEDVNSNYAFSDALYTEAALEAFGEAVDVSQLSDEQLDFLAWYLYGKD